jgi:hypothetical protein
MSVKKNLLVYIQALAFARFAPFILINKPDSSIATGGSGYRLL